MSDERKEREIVESIQSRVERERETPIIVQLGDPGPYRLPVCSQVLSSYVLDERIFELEVVTEAGRRLFLPIHGSQLGALRALLNALASKEVRQTPDEKP